MSLFSDQTAPDNANAYSVSELSQAVKRTVETSFDFVRVRGEISRPTYARSGHLYFTLKDEKSVLDVVCWKGQVARQSFRAEEGMEIIAQGRLTTYPGSSKYQLVMDSMELAGEGALLKLLEERRKRLAAEGLFDPERKRALPFLPRVIGVVTSPTGAVFRDILHRISDRFPVTVRLWPVKVQGDGAAEQITAAIEGFNKLPAHLQPDVLIVGRGGGSLEDLWAFNDEALVRALAASRIPTISAVGHETDTTLADFAADLRAPTPTGAAEQAVPVRNDLLASLQDLAARLTRASFQGLSFRQDRLDGLARGLPRPEQLLALSDQHVDTLSRRLDQGLVHLVRLKQQSLDRHLAGLRHPVEAVRYAQRDLTSVWQAAGHAIDLSLRDAVRRLQTLSPTPRLEGATRRQIKTLEQQVGQTAALLASYEALETRAMARGYARVEAHDGQLITAHHQLTHGQVLQLVFADGRSWAQTLPDESAPKTESQSPPSPIAAPSTPQHLAKTLSRKTATRKKRDADSSRHDDAQGQLL